MTPTDQETPKEEQVEQEIPTLPTDEEIFDKIKTAMIDLLELEEDEITLEADLRDDLGLDSVDMFEMLSELEDTYGLTIEVEELMELNISTLEDVVGMVQMLIKRKIEEIKNPELAKERLAKAKAEAEAKEKAKKEAEKAEEDAPAKDEG